jgi:hypothetical protein
MPESYNSSTAEDGFKPLFSTPLQLRYSFHLDVPFNLIRSKSLFNTNNTAILILKELFEHGTSYDFFMDTLPSHGTAHVSRP